MFQGDAAAIEAVLGRLKSGLPWNWSLVTEPRFVDGLRERLRLELAPGHELFGVPLRTMARSGANDDVLFASPALDHFYVVHLTWELEPEPAPFPIIVYDGDLDGFFRWASEDA